MQRLRKTADDLHASFTPKGQVEGKHVPHWHGTKADFDGLVAEMNAEKSPFARRAMRDQLARFLIVKDDDAAKHADIVARLPAAAEALLQALDLHGPGVHPRPATEDEDEVIGKIAGDDARRFIVKTFREVRQKIGNRSTVDVDAVATKMAEHLGVSDLEPLKAALEAEVAEFTAERDAALAEHGVHAACHEDLGFLDARLQQRV